MSRPWERLDRVVIVVRDQSGSMDLFNHSIHQACQDMEKTIWPPLTACHFVAFSAFAEHSAFIEDLRNVGGGTSIASAFKLVLHLLGTKGTPAQVDVVFISDGEDSASKSLLDIMTPLPCHCRLFCVGVKAEFPTNLVSDHLYAKFGWGSDPSAPPVIPLESPSETQGVFRQLAGYLAEAKARPAPKEEDITEAMSAAELGWAAKAVSFLT